ncbi:SGNH/GDSL hydrolase family protein [Priestia abyssalis]|uniref:SGNH/GDSL hydrolase family protein n=1 Tax=Priestia abyssalis TaxID=1221450 RepID=UPI00099594A9|nr:SGNH/GDSL hydrolase family protein [Priestia abyssalis]
MNKKWFYCFVCACFLTACSSPAFLMKQPLEIEAKQTNLQVKSHIPKGFFPVDLNIVAIGDSLTEGVGDSSKQGGYVPYVVKFISEHKAVDDVRVSNLGKRGNRTDQLLERLKQEEVVAKVSRADIVFMTIGGNDMMKVVRDFFYNISLKTFEKEQSKYEARLSRVLERIREINPGGHIYLIGFYNPFLHSLKSVNEINIIVKQWNEASEKVAGRYKDVTYVNVEDVFEVQESLLAKDQFHPNKKGYELIAQRINEYVLEQQEEMNSIELAKPEAE